MSAPTSALQGESLRLNVDAQIAAAGPTTGTERTLGPRGDEDNRSLELTGSNGSVVVIHPYDPNSGMSGPPELVGPGVVLRGDTVTVPIEFPLATAWDDLPPGDYRCRLRLWFEVGRDGHFRRTLVSPEFPLRIEPAPPREETFLLPKVLRIVETTFTTRHDEATIPMRQVVYGEQDAEEVRLPRRNGFFLGTNLLRDGETYATLGRGTVEPDDAMPIDTSYGTGPDAQKLGASYTIVIFETADAPEHMWHPGPGSDGYRELWRRTIAVAPPDARDSKPASIAVRATTPDGAPLANAEIVLQRLEPEFIGHRRATTGADGLARFEALRPGPYRVGLAEAPGAPEPWMNTNAEDWETCARVELAEGGTSEVALAAPRFVSFEVSADAADFPEGVRPGIDVLHLYSGGSWCHASHQTSWKPERSDDRRIVWRVTDVPEGRYRVRLFAKGRASSTREIDVRKSEEPWVVRMTPGPAVEPVELVYDGPPLTRDHYFTMSGADRAEHDVESGTFAGTPPSSVVTQARPGRYVLTLWRSGCAMLLDVPESGARRFDVTVPAWTVPAAGATDVTVRVTRGGARLQRMMVALAPASDEPLASGRWFRCADASPGKFAGVGPGDWDVFAFDGVYGEWYGFEASPLVRRIRVGADPVSVTFDL